MDSSSARSCNAMEKEIVNLIVRVFKNCPFHRCFPPLYSKWTNGESQVLRSILDGMTEGNLGDDWPVDDEGTTYYVPKNMAGVAARFARDMYWNEVPVTVTDGELTIGVKLDNYTNSCWVMFDEFRLILLEPEQQPVVINVTDVSQLDNAIYMNPQVQDRSANIG